MTDPVQLPAVVWYKNSETIGAGVAFVMAAGVFIPRLKQYLGNDPAIIESHVEAALTLIGVAISGISALVALIQRLRNKTVPIALTQKRADAHAATISASTNPPESPL